MSFRPLKVYVALQKQGGGEGVVLMQSQPRCTLTWQASTLG